MTYVFKFISHGHNIELTVKRDDIKPTIPSFAIVNLGPNKRTFKFVSTTGATAGEYVAYYEETHPLQLQIL
jgi:hypothetical protein